MSNDNGSTSTDNNTRADVYDEVQQAIFEGLPVCPIMRRACICDDCALYIVWDGGHGSECAIVAAAVALSRTANSARSIASCI